MAATSISAGSVTGQTITPLPVVISCSNNPQVTTVDHGRPFSFEVQPLHKAGQVGLHQGVKFGLLISKDKIQISSNPAQEGVVGAGEEVRESVMQVGDDGIDTSQESQAPGHEGSAGSFPLSPLCLALPEWDVLEKELDEFQQILSSMTSPTSSFVLSSLPSPGSWKPISKNYNIVTLALQLGLMTRRVRFVPS